MPMDDERSSVRSVSPLLTSAIVAVLTTAVAGLLGALFALRASSDSAGAPIVAASIALVGSLWGGAATVLGLLLKHSVDQRANDMAAAAESRLRMDTAIKAIELMEERAGEPTVARQRRSGGLLALVSLKQTELALTLVEQLWESDQIDTAVAISVIDACLTSTSASAQENAARVLARDHLRLLTKDNWQFPRSVFLKWMPDLTHSARDGILMLLPEILLSRKPEEWKSFCRNQFLYCFYKIARDDQDPRIFVAAALFAKALIPYCTRSGTVAFCPPDRHMITYSEIEKEADLQLASVGGKYDNITVAANEIAQRITDWSPQPAHACTVLLLPNDTAS